jgi:RHS repeat-associated protein
VASLQGGVAYFIMPDHLGAPHEIVNAANARVWFWDHDPFGNGTPTAAAGFSHDLRFPGQIYDSETRLHNNGFRDYSPTLGRYVQSDPLGLEGGINTYAYAKNNPLSAIDQLGLEPDEEASVEYRLERRERLSFRDALVHWATGGGAAIEVPLSSLDLSSVSASKTFGNRIDFPRPVTLSGDDFLVYGTVSFTLVEPDIIKSTVGYDTYNFDMKSWKDSPLRNLATIGGLAVSEIFSYGTTLDSGTPFRIYFDGTVRIRP